MESNKVRKRETLLLLPTVVTRQMMGMIYCMKINHQNITEVLAVKGEMNLQNEEKCNNRH